MLKYDKTIDGIPMFAYKLVRIGLIGFDRKTNKYMAVGKLRELLGHPEEDNQQPSRSGDISEGSTTRDKSQVDDNIPKSAGH